VNFRGPRARGAVRALELADAAIARSPDLVQAHWNRALALRKLDLPLAAAAELDAVAARGEPGWADEARRIAATLRTPIETRHRDIRRRRWPRCVLRGWRRGSRGPRG